MREYNQQNQRVGRDQYNAEGNINQYQGHHYQHQGNMYDDHGRYQYINQQHFEREPKSLSAVEIFAVILLQLLGVVLFFGGGALGIYGFGAFGNFEILHGVSRTLLGIVGIVLFLMSLGIFTYMSIQYPQLRNHNNYGRRQW